ncbi:DNA mismatch repair protein MutS2 [Paucidesulfovibrio gracilis DSM 16080]|uniref:Endonuclease MutS2 n=1 Tax=Paucidesulfovibrio gracilis DSM 16080 TaxID=1121449 RepID=A0A1T4WMF4_9BACT|nr:Smr/MutS family protein [Paucidesulfovibrio gracilis]SKA78514.1 DNA mismatch repair protein MutS2 [Paucidesulfovibrio gracilis DSM 16080]
MDSRTAQLLEFPKILDALAGFAVSEPGAEACRELTPYDSLSEIRNQNDLVALAREWVGVTGFRLTWFPALDGLFAFAEARKQRSLDIDDFTALGQVLRTAREAWRAFSEGDERYLRLREALGSGSWPVKLVSAVTRCIDAEGRIRDEASPELSVVRSEIRSIHQRCTKKVKDFILGRDLSHFLQDEFMTLASDRYVLPLKANFKGRFQGIIHDYSQTGETCYFEPMFLVELNNQLQEYKKEEAVEEQRVLEYLTGLFRQERQSVENCYTFLVQLDVILAKVALGHRLDARPLEVDESANLHLPEARHPLLVLAGHSVQAVDVSLRPGDRTLVISGGNAGGKTVTLKAVGLCALMAYAGLPVPVAAGGTLAYLPRVFVIMGDEQSLEGHVSTFTAQIQYFSRAWEQVDQKSLFLLDEFGAGTDPTQGAALAQAVIDKLTERGGVSLAATHFPALKAYALATEGVRAASVLFDPKTKKPLYRLAYDQVGASIALDVAREHGFPAEILQKAEQYLLLEGSETGSVLGRLNSLAVKRQQELDELAEQKQRVASRRHRLEEDFDKKKNQLLEEVRCVSQTVLREWKEGRAGRKQALKKLAEVRERVTPDEPKNAPAQTVPFGWDDVHVDGQVLYLPWDKRGRVVEKDEKKRRVKVDLDGVAMWVNGSDLGPASTREQKTRVVTPSAPAAGPTLTLDLRGMRADVAISELERFLDAALLRGATTLEIVHGRGTGALRREVHQFLKQFPAVEQFSLAPEDRGGDGMTEVTLK